MEHRMDTLDNGLAVHSLWAGNSSLPPLILLHGYPSNALLWRHIIPDLARHFCVYAPDLPGHGDSDKPLDVDYDLDFFVGFLKAYILKMQLSPVHLAVHDLGAAAGLGLVTRHPAMVQKFIVMDCAPYVAWSKFLQLIVNRSKSPFWSRWLLLRPIFKNVLKRTCVYSPQCISAETAEMYRKPWVQNSQTRKAFCKVVSAPPEKITVPKKHLKQISVHTMILWAQNDLVIRPKVARQLHSDIPGAKLTILDRCGHFFQEEQPEKMTDHMLSFLLTD